MENKLEKRLINNLRFNAVNMVECAGSGHLGMALGIAPTLYVLFAKHLNILPSDPCNVLRDRFVMSAGHGCSILYSIMNILGYDIKESDLKNFRKSNSLTPGHPSIKTPGIDYTAGPLGQGVANAVGMAIAEKMLAEKINNDVELVDNYTYCLVGDGCLMEGVSFEALSLAGSLDLNKLIIIYDRNKITKDGDLCKVFDINIKQYVKSMGYNVIEILDGDNIEEINDAFIEAKKSEKGPVFIIVNTKIGFGTISEGCPKVHSGKLGQDEIREFKKRLDIHNNPFEYDKDVQKLITENKKRFNIVKKNFDERVRYYQKYLPENYAKFEEFVDGKIDISEMMRKYKVGDNFKSTCCYSGDILRDIVKDHFNVVGGSADVSSSTNTKLGKHSIADSFRYNEIKYGVREFAMAGISNGLALYGFKPFCCTFLAFSDYMKPAIRMSAIMNLPVKYIFTHDGFCSNDGVAHLPVEHIMELRSIPNLNVYRPADFIETKACYESIYSLCGPSALILSKLDSCKLNTNYHGALKGGYILKLESDNHLDLIIIATGSELKIANELAKELELQGRGVRVVSMPCFETFDKQTKNYREAILPKGVPKMSIEAGSTLGWNKYVDNGVCIGVDDFSTASSVDDLYKNYGMTCKELFKKAKKLLK